MAGRRDLERSTWLPVVSGINGCTWVSWWKSTRQVNLAPGSGPFRVDTRPAYVIVSPALYCEPAGGSVIVAVGGWLLVTVSVAALLVALPRLFVTMAELRRRCHRVARS